jgi:hypothetical protein
MIEIALILGGGQREGQIGHIDESTRSIFGRSYAEEPEKLVEDLANDLRPIRSC